MPKRLQGDPLAEHYFDCWDDAVCPGAAKAGGVDLVVKGLMDVAGGEGPYLMLGCLFVMCAAIGLFISNTATAVLMAPSCLSGGEVNGRLTLSFLPWWWRWRLRRRL